VLPDLKEVKVLLAQVDKPAVQVPLAQLVLPEQQVKSEQLDRTGLQAQLAPMEPLARLV
jgi:hypothetical protein